jgi:hydrogenase nickel incorporation protein HypA/HybF
MHEIRIAEDLSAIVLETALENKLSHVTAVNIVIGQMVAVAPDVFRMAFREAVMNTPAENARVRIEIVPAKLRCIECGTAFTMEESLFRCSSCGSANPEIIKGRELFIKSIEGE